MKVGIFNVTPPDIRSTFTIQFDYGSQIEENGFRGISHLAEHLLCKGMDKYQSELDSERISLNAWTSSTEVAFYISGLDHYLNKWVDIFTNEILNYKITEEEFEKEKKIVLSEYRDTFSSSLSTQFILNFERYYFNNYNPIGHSEDIENISFNEFNEFVETYYRKPTTIIYESIDYEYENDSIGFSAPKLDTVDNSIITGTENEIEIFNDTSESDNSIIVSFTDVIDIDDICKYSFICDMFADGLQSPVYAIREEHGLCYHVSFSTSIINAKQFYLLFKVETANDNVKQVLELFEDIFFNTDDTILKDRFEITLQSAKISKEYEEINKEYNEINKEIYVDEYFFSRLTQCPVTDCHCLYDKKGEWISIREIDLSKVFKTSTILFRLFFSGFITTTIFYKFC